VPIKIGKVSILCLNFDFFKKGCGSRGLVYSISNRIISMVERIGLEEPVCITGGVAKNFAVVRALEELLSVKIYVPEEPQITGALGAALLA